ncbi:MAG: hypothetical protein NW201_00205 [Gemmatimonadales bacterium]|nr:hypothetical protein [Gemmatimonadales bacterium]
MSPLSKPPLDPPPTVLLVMRSHDRREALRRVLADDGIVALTAAETDEALAALRAAVFDALLIGIDPGSDAPWTELDALLAEAPELPVVLLADQPDVATALEGVRRRVAGYLPSSASPAELLEAARRASEDARIRRHLADRALALRASVEPLRQLGATVPAGSPAGQVLAVADAMFAALAQGLVDLHSVLTMLPERTTQREVCTLESCPRSQWLAAAVRETIATLEATKGAFKSKELGRLRQRLELVLCEAEGAPGTAPAQVVG